MAEAVAGSMLADEATLKRFVAAVLARLGVEAAAADTVADVLVAADMRGIPAHGVACLADYAAGLRSGRIAAAAAPAVVRETPSSVLIDAGNGLGPPVAADAMQRVIAKAGASGAAFGAVRNANHFGIAAYYAMLALDHDLIGIASTNAPRIAAPTFGFERLLGANPLAFAVPAGDEPAFVLDFATTHASPDGTLLPLGGLGVDTGGHKGYGLGLLVDIMCGVMAGGAFGAELPAASDGLQTGGLSHFCAAFRIDGFRDVVAFKADMDEELRALKGSRKSPGRERIYAAGEIEAEKTHDARRWGVPLSAAVRRSLEDLAADTGVPFTL